MSLWFPAPAPLPSTGLGRHRRLAPAAGVHVSPIALGAMSIGDQWPDMGTLNKEDSFKLLDAYYDAGGNFIDTANNYQEETSEEFIGEWMEKRGNRAQMVVATKYTTNYKRFKDIKQKTQYSGNSLKAMRNSVDDSLRKLRTDYIDILYVHWWDYNTSIEEVMNGLHQLVMAGKVLYLGISDTPAWVVSRANTYARMSSRTPFVIYQGAWNVLSRDLEREIIPMCREEGMAISVWNVLASGKIRSDAEEERRRKTGSQGRAIVPGQWERTEDEKKICKALEKVAEEVGAKQIGSVAIAYVMQKVPYVFPCLGGRSIDQMLANTEALEIALTPEHIKYIESILPFDFGFPYTLFGNGEENNVLFNSAGTFDKWPAAQPIQPNKA